MALAVLVAVPALPLRANEAVAYDSARDRLIVHGGSDVRDETWEWDGISARGGWLPPRVLASAVIMP